METANSTLSRTNPNIEPKSAYRSIKVGLALIILFTIIVILFDRILISNHLLIPKVAIILRQWYYWVILLFILSMFLLYILVGIGFVITGVSFLIRRSNWIKNAVKTQATIVDRRMRHDFKFGEDDSYEVYIPELELKYIPIKAKINSSELAIWANVDKSIYEKYEDRDIADVYYSVNDPCEILIFGE
jgi:hypothetical protein